MAVNFTLLKKWYQFSSKNAVQDAIFSYENSDIMSLFGHSVQTRVFSV